MNAHIVIEGLAEDERLAKEVLEHAKAIREICSKFRTTATVVIDDEADPLDRFGK